MLFDGVIVVRFLVDNVTVMWRSGGDDLDGNVGIGN